MFSLKVEANFDVLFTLDRISFTHGPMTIFEIHSLCYLAQLLSVYDGNPMSEWGYYFIYKQSQGLFSREIESEIERLIQHGWIEEEGKDYKKIKLNQKGLSFLQNIQLHKIYKWRKKYLIACADAALSLPLPTVINSLKNEPMISNSNDKRELLGTGVDIEMLYEHFDAIKNVLGKDIQDLWAAALLWLEYLNKVACDKVRDDDEYQY